MLTKVKLHGALADAMGRADWQFELTSPREVVRALEANTGGKFKRHVLGHDQHGTEYRFIIDGRDFEHIEDLVVNRQPESIELVPVPAGSGLGLWEAIAGIALIIIGVVFSAYLGPLATPVISLGVGLLLGGVSQMFFAPHAAVPTASDRGEDKENQPSYLFSGVTNTVQQGGPVPVLYGRMIVGSQLISAGVTTTPVDLAGKVLGGTAVNDDPKVSIVSLPVIQKIKKFSASSIADPEQDDET